MVVSGLPDNRKLSFRISHRRLILRRTHSFICLIFIASTLVAAQQPQATPTPAATNDQAAMDKRMQDLEDRIVALEGEIRQLKAQGAQPAQPTQPGAAPSATPSAEAAQTQAPPAQPA